VDKERECYDCKYACCDPDGPYCGHPESFKQTGFGRGFNMMRNAKMHPETAVCGAEGDLWEAK
jgi:hypothetical protein